MWLLPVYTIFWLALALAIMVPWSYKDNVADIVRYQQPGNLSPGWQVATWKTRKAHEVADFWSGGPHFWSSPPTATVGLTCSIKA